ESVRSETVCENRIAEDLFAFVPASFEESVRRALEKTQAGDLETKWTSASAPVIETDIDPSHLLTDQQVIDIPASPEKVFRVVSSIGGNNGWLFGNWLWRMRGFLDKQIGGVGLRRGRRHAIDLGIGEALDFWRVEDFEQNQRLLLRAEMKLPGRGWLEFVLERLEITKTRLIQTAKYYPKGLLGMFYWFVLHPFHWIMFRGLARAIAKQVLRHQSNSVAP
ncbi:MAG TPA: DUF2867 domain-containing protein, partial [Acidobacteriota bacterium]|nr:DUF2867 domain-containing protein [Acidobacteriota bacterium]